MGNMNEATNARIRDKEIVNINTTERNILNITKEIGKDKNQKKKGKKNLSDEECIGRIYIDKKKNVQE